MAIAIIKHHIQEGNLQKKAFNLGAQYPRGLEYITLIERSMAAGRLGAEAVTESLYLIYMHETEIQH